MTAGLRFCLLPRVDLASHSLASQLQADRRTSRSLGSTKPRPEKSPRSTASFWSPLLPRFQDVHTKTVFISEIEKEFTWLFPFVIHVIHLWPVDCARTQQLAGILITRNSGVHWLPCGMLFFKACKEVRAALYFHTLSSFICRSWKVFYCLWTSSIYRLVSGGSGGQTQPRLSLTVSAEETTRPVSWSVRGNQLHTDTEWVSRGIWFQWMPGIWESTIWMRRHSSKNSVRPHRTNFIIHRMHVHSILQIPVVVLSEVSWMALEGR